MLRSIVLFTALIVSTVSLPLSYVCTSMDNTDYFDYHSFTFPDSWFRTSYNGACVYDCEPYRTIGKVQVGYHATCGLLDTSKLLQLDTPTPPLLFIPHRLFQRTGTFKSFNKGKEYTICVYKNDNDSDIECGYNEVMTTLVSPTPTTLALLLQSNTSTPTPTSKYIDEYRRLRTKHSELLQYKMSAVIYQKMKRIRQKMRGLLVHL